MKNLLQRAIDLAKRAHEGQTRRDGTPYIEHPMRVMRRVEEYCESHLQPSGIQDVLILAVLHDAMEDCTDPDVVKDIDDLLLECRHTLKFHLNTLTKEPGMTYQAYIDRIVESNSWKPLLVKKMDMLENMEGCWIEINEGRNVLKACKQLRKYTKHYARICDALENSW